jgi:hypothetical protein
LSSEFFLFASEMRFASSFARSVAVMIVLVYFVYRIVKNAYGFHAPSSNASQRRACGGCRGRESGTALIAMLNEQRNNLSNAGTCDWAS